MGRIIILGAGNMGSYIASNLAAEYDITVIDYNQANLDRIINTNIKKIKADLSNLSIVENEVKNFDLVVSALPESFGYSALKAVIKAGKNVVDISFWAQNSSRLSGIEKLARKNKVTAFIDCGIAPGFSNGIVAFFDNLLKGKTKNASIYVGGIPKDRKRGFFAPWSIPGLIEEYQRKALIVRNKRTKKVQALSITERLSFSQVGELEGAITDGLRTLPLNLKHLKNMSEFTLRYPGHFSQMKILGELGYFSEDEISTGKDKVTAYDVSQLLLKRVRDKPKYEEVLKGLGFYDKSSEHDCVNKKVSPKGIAAAVLSNLWKMRPEDKDVLVMRVQADDEKTRYTADVYAEHDGKISAMALTTGGMAALAARAVITKKFDAIGVFPLERAVKEKPNILNYFINGLQRFGVSYSQRESKLS